MLSGLFQSAKSAYNTASATAETISHLIYGKTEGQLTTYEESFIKSAKELCKSNGGKLPSGAVVLFAFMDKYIARSARPLKDMTQVEVVKQCKSILANRGDEAIPEVMNQIREVKVIEQDGYFATLLNVFFYLFPQHDPHDLDNLKNAKGQRKVLAPAKYQLNKWYEQVCNAKTFPHQLAGYQLEQVAENIPDQYVDAFAYSLLNNLQSETVHSLSDLAHEIKVSSKFIALGILFKRVKTRDLKASIKKRLEDEAEVTPGNLSPCIIGAALALRRIDEYCPKAMAIALISYVSNHMDVILQMPDRIKSAYDANQKHEFTVFLSKIFQALLQYERSLGTTQMQTIMFHLLQAKYCDLFRYEINLLRYWMSQEQLAQFRALMTPKKDTNDETYFVCRPWLEDRHFLVPAHYQKQPYTDRNLAKMLTPTQQEPLITTYQMPLAARLKALMRDMDGEESIEKGNGEHISMSVISSLYTVIPHLCAELRTKDRGSFSVFLHDESLNKLHEVYLQYMDAVTLLNASQQFSKDSRLAFAKQILETIEMLDPVEQFIPVHAALSICPDLLDDAALKALCEKTLLKSLVYGQLGKHEASIMNAFSIYANKIEFNELPPLLLAMSTDNSTTTLFAMHHVNKIYEKRWPAAQHQARVDKSMHISDNASSNQYGK